MGDFELLKELRERPSGPPLMLQSWRNLTFLHFACDPEEIQAILPDGLTVETYPDDEGKEKAWIGFVPFRMEGIRFRGTPSIPGLSAFPETNVRTYVTYQGRDPGVWFFSLDAQNAFACWFARRFFGLPYHFARMSVRSEVDSITYTSQRNPETKHRVKTRPTGHLRTAEFGTFEFWLLERYLLYANRHGSLWKGRVHHAPYTFQDCIAEVEEAGYISPFVAPAPFVSQLYSPGLNVEVFSVKPVN